jgi:hypothetical protein
MMPVCLVVGISGIRFCWREALTGVLDQSRTCGNPLRREGSHSLDVRLPYLEWNWRFVFAIHSPVLRRFSLSHAAHG